MGDRSVLGEAPDIPEIELSNRSDQQEKPALTAPRSSVLWEGHRQKPSAETAEATAPREGKAWKNLGYAGASLGTLSLVLGLSVSDRLRTNADGPDRGRTPDAPLHDPHAVRHGKNAPTDDKEWGQRLVQYRREAEEALILAIFYEREGATDKLRKCLEALARWRKAKIALHGEPRIAVADGLVISQTPEDTIERDFWDRATKAIQQLSQQLDEPPVQGASIPPAHKGK